MDKLSLEKSITRLRKHFLSMREDLNNFLRQELKLVVDELPSYPGRYSWVIKYPSPKLVTKKIYLDFYADGNIIYSFQDKLTISEQTSLDTSADFLEPDMGPEVNNVINLGKYNGVENLIKKINLFLNTSSTEDGQNKIEVLTFSNTQKEMVDMDETGILNHMFYKGNEFTMRSVKGKEKITFKDAYVVYEGPVDEKDITYKNPRQI